MSSPRNARVESDRVGDTQGTLDLVEAPVEVHPTNPGGRARGPLRPDHRDTQRGLDEGKRAAHDATPADGLHRHQTGPFDHRDDAGRIADPRRLESILAPPPEDERTLVHRDHLDRRVPDRAPDEQRVPDPSVERGREHLGFDVLRSAGNRAAVDDQVVPVGQAGDAGLMQGIARHGVRDVNPRNGRPNLVRHLAIPRKPSGRDVVLRCVVAQPVLPDDEGGVRAGQKLG